MSEISLQRAAHIFNRIKTETAFGGSEDEDSYGYGRRRRAPKTNTFALNINVSVDHPVRQMADAYRNLALGKMEKLFSLMEIGTRIRIAMTTQQAKVGVSGLVTTRVGVVNKIKILEHLLESVETNGVYVPEMVESQAALIKQRLDASTQGNTTANIGTAVLTSEDREMLGTMLADARSRLMGIDDELARLNATTNIEVSSDDMKVLRAAGLAA